MAKELSVKVKVKLDTTKSSLEGELKKVTEYTQKNPVAIDVKVNKTSLKKSLDEAFGKGAAKSLENIQKQAKSASNAIKETANAQEQLSATAKTTNNNTSEQKDKTKQLTRALNDYISAARSAASANADMAKFSANGSEDNVEVAYDKMISAADKMGEAASRIHTLIGDDDNKVDLLDRFPELAKAVEDGAYKVEVAYNNMGQSASQATVNQEHLTTSIETLKSKATALSTQAQDLANKGADIASFNDAFKKFNDIANDDSGYENQAQQLRALQDQLKNCNLAYAQMSRQIKSTNDSLGDQKGFADLSAQIERFMAVNKNVSKNTDLYNNMQRVRNEVANCTGDLQAQRTAWAKLEAQAEQLGLTVESIDQKLVRLFKEHFQTAMIMAGLHLIQQGAQQVYQNVVEINTAMTELKKVTDETDATYDQFLLNAADKAKKLGATISDVVNATADFARLGYSIEDSAELANSAILYKNVGDGIDDVSEATESIISTMKAFNIQAQNSIQIVDKFNKVGNKFAISSEGIGQALQRSASSLNAAGNDINQSIGMIVAANDVVQNPEEVGNALRVVAMRIRGAKTELEDAGESTDGMAKSTAKLREEMKNLADVEIMDTNSAFKSTYDIMDQLAAKWKDLSDIDQANILEQIAGKNRANIVAGMLENWDDAKAAMEAAQDATGSATEENEKYLNSINGLIEVMKASFEGLSENLLDDDVIKNVVKLGTAIIDLINDVVKFTGVLPPAAAALSSLFTVGSAKQIANVQKQLDGTTNSAITAAKELAKVNSIAGAWGMLGASGKAQFNNNKDIENFAIQLQNLSQKEQAAASHLVNLSNEQREYLNSVQQSLANGESLNTQLYQRELSTTSLSQAQQQNIMVEAGLMTSDGQYNLLSAEQARLNLENSTTFTTLTAEEQHETRAAISQTVAKQAQAAATNAATKAQLLFNAAVSVGKQLLLSLAIGAVVFAVEKLIKLIKSSIKTYEDLANKASEANKAYEETATTLEDLNKQWKDLQKKKDEASKTDGVTDEETAKIERQSKYLEAQIKLYEILAKQKAEEANKAAYDVANAENNVSLNQPEYSIFDDPNGIGIQPKTVKNSEYLDELAEKYDTLSGKLSDLNQAWNDGKISQEEYEKQSESLSGQIDDTGNTITDTYQKISDNYAKAQDDGSETYKAIKDDFDHATDSFNGWANTYGDGISDVAAANNELTDTVDDASDTLADTYEKLNSAIDEIQSAYNALSSAVEEYNEHGALSMDTLQSLLNMDDKYLACLVNENGQLSLNVDSFQQLAEARLNDAKAAAVEQAMQELNAVASQTEATAAANSITAIANKGAAVDTLAIKYTNLGNCAAYAAQAQAMADAYTAAAAKDATAADNIMAGLNAKLGLIDSTMNSIKSSATGAGNALGGYSNAASKASKASDALKDSLEKQKEAAEDAKDELEAYSNKLKIWGEAATKELDKRKKALEDQKDAQDKLYDDEIDRLKADQDAKDEAFDKEKKRLNEEKKLQDKLYKQQKEELQNQKELQDEVYQKQIDALKEKKQALQDANDEEDRAIKLAELQDALEKAKSQRTMRVYQHDTGFEWQTNENDVSNAQNALDDQQRTWKREDAIKAIEDEIDAIEKLKDAYDDQIDAKIDALDKEKDAYDEWIDGRLNQIETEKDAFDEMIDGQIEDIEKRQEAFDAEMDAEMDKLDELKDKYQEAMDLIGTSWEDYQEQLKAAAAFQEMSFADMSSYVSGYKDNVLANMQQIAEAEKQVNAITEQLAGLDDSSGSGSGGGGGGGSGGGLKALSLAADDASGKIDSLKDKIVELGDKNNDLKAQQQDLQDQLATLTEGTAEHTETMNQLGEVQDQIAANTTALDGLTQQYIETILNETDATQADRDTQIRMITELMNQYGISYKSIAGYLSDYVNNVGTATISADGSYRTMADTIMGFCRSAQDQIHGTTSYIDELIAKCGALVKACNEAQQAQRELEARQAYNANARANGQNYTNRVAASGVQVKGGFASGSNRVGGPGIYSVDEHGNELIQRTRTLGNGRYVQLEYGDAVYPAKATKNLFDIGANPIGWMKDNISKIVGDFGAIKAVNGHQSPINLTFGDIIVQKPVGNADDLAQSLMQNLPTSFIQELGRNR